MNPVFELGLDLPPAGSRRLRQELHRQMRAAILDGRLAPGLQLPASRVLAELLGISRNSVLTVYDLLQSEGYIQARPGAGVFVSAIRGGTQAVGPAPSARPQKPVKPLIDLRLGLPDIGSFPFDQWRRLYGRALRAYARRTIGHCNPAGYFPLREAIAGHVSFTRAVACDPERIVVTAGSQQAFSLLARILVTPERPVVAVEDPGYPQLRAAFTSAGAKLQPVPVDDHGLIVERVPKDAAVICVTPSHQFPLGAVLSPERRRKLLAFAAEHDAVIVEDDYDSEFRFAGRPLDALQTLDCEGRVFYVGTFSKILFPGLRLGFVVGPAEGAARLAEARRILDWHGPALDQEVLADFIAEGHLARHVRRMRRIYETRRTAMLQALGQYCHPWLDPIPSSAGLHLAARFRRPCDAAELVARAASFGIAIEDLGRYAFSLPAPKGLAFGYGLAGPDAIETALVRVAALLGASSPGL